MVRRNLLDFDLSESLDCAAPKYGRNLAKGTCNGEHEQEEFGGTTWSRAFRQPADSRANAGTAVPVQGDPIAGKNQGAIFS